MTCQGLTNPQTKYLVCAIHVNRCKAVVALQFAGS